MMNESESGIIGSILIDPKSIYDVYHILKPEMFQDDFLGDTYNTILAMYDCGEDINLVTLTQKMESNKYDQKTIGENIAKCIADTPTSVYLKSYADTVIKEYKSRKVKALFENVSLLPRDIDSTISECLTRLEELKTNQKQRSKSMKEIVSENKDNYFKEDVGVGGVKTGLYRLDDCLGILEPGDVTVLAARPSVGKSALASQILAYASSKGHKCGYFNMEMLESQIYERFLAKNSHIPLTRIRRAKAFLDDEKDAFEKANEEIAKYDIIVSTGSKTVGEIRSECRHQDFKLVVIDYLQLIKADKRYSSRASEVGDISKSIKSMASELGVHVILLSQLNRSSELRDTKEPSMSELRESGDIEQDASNIVLLWNLVEENRSFKGLKVDKQRQGENIKEGIYFDGSKMEFEERNEDFKQFLKRAREASKGTDFSPSGGDSPFEGW